MRHLTGVPMGLRSNFYRHFVGCLSFILVAACCSLTDHSALQAQDRPAKQNQSVAKANQNRSPNNQQLTRAQRRNQVRARQATALRQQRSIQQQRSLNLQAEVNRFAFQRYLAVQELWAVQMYLPNGYPLERTYLGRSSYQAQLQARAQFP